MSIQDSQPSADTESDDKPAAISELYKQEVLWKSYDLYSFELSKVSREGSHLWVKRTEKAVETEQLVQIPNEEYDLLNVVLLKDESNNRLIKLSKNSHREVDIDFSTFEPGTELPYHWEIISEGFWDSHL